MAPQYLQAYCEPMSACSSRRLRSVSSSLLAVPRTRTNYGDRRQDLPSMDIVCGIVFLMNCDHLTSLWLCSETNWKRYYLTCNCCFLAHLWHFAKLRFINALNNTNNIGWHDRSWTISIWNLSLLLTVTSNNFISPCRYIKRNCSYKIS